jgi:hypothetical protein
MAQREYTTRTQAKADLGVRRIIDDVNVYDSLKLLAAFVRKAGFGGLLVFVDELVVISNRLPSMRARQANYEAVLAIVKDRSRALRLASDSSWQGPTNVSRTNGAGSSVTKPCGHG